MKRVLTFLLAITMLVCLCACGGNDSTKKDTEKTTKATEQTTTTTTAEATTTTTTATEVTTTEGGATEESTTTATEVTTTAATEAPTTAPTDPTTTTTKAPTTTTQKPTTTTTTTVTYEPVPESISILSVGNSFSVDAMRNHLYPMLKAAGYKEIRLGILYVGGASIDTHYDNIRLDRAKYDYYETTDGEWKITPEYKASTAFALTDWDYVTVQQVSGQSGRNPSFTNLNALMDLIQPQIGDAKVYWHMTWAYQQDSTHSDFANYNKDQSRMYRGIVNVINTQIVNNPDFLGFIPSGTSIQNLRTSKLGDTLTADGYHLSDTYGDYTAALTWFCFFSGRPATSMTYRPDSISAYFDQIAESVDNAIKTPLAVTACK